ncbi:MAG TPA: EamA family transporter [Halococcus sp.]|nr:EamA family transporter [Halococcus sp.]
MNYLVWTIIALLAYTVFPPLVSLASREIPSNVITLVATVMLATGALIVALTQEDEILTYLSTPTARYVYLAGISLTVGIIAYYRALAHGPVSVVTPVFGMFIVTSSLVSIVFLGGAFSLRDGAGIACAALAIYLIAG